MTKIWILVLGIMLSCEETAEFSIGRYGISVSEFPNEIELGNELEFYVNYFFPDGCLSFHELRVREENNNVTVDFFVKQSNSLACPLIATDDSIKVGHTPHRTGDFFYNFNEGKLVKRVVVN